MNPSHVFEKTFKLVRIHTLQRAFLPLLTGGALVTIMGCGALAGDSEPETTSQQALKTQPTASVSNGTLQVKGSADDGKVTLRLQAGAPNILEVDVGDDGAADFTFDRNQFDRIVVQGGSGDDVLRIDEANGAFTDTEITTLDGGKGNDTLIGGSFAETLIGGPGNDTITGGRGNDVLFGGAGSDTFVWNPGDGSDVIEGEDGTDTLDFHGAAIAENIELSANGSRLRFTRDIASIALDLNGVERVSFSALGGADNVVVNDLTGTGVKLVSVDFAGPDGAADGQLDSVILKGTSASETINVSADGAEVVADGLGTQVRVKGYEPDDRIVTDGVGQDVVNVNGSTGADTMNINYASGYARVTVVGWSSSVDVRGELSLFVNGLDGPDTITSSFGVPSLGVPIVIDGGRGDDTLEGASITLLGGPGDDTFVWRPGDSNGVIEGQGGRDVLDMRTAAIDENIALSANGSRLRLTRDIANVTLDVNGVEQVDLAPLGGTDNVVVNDLTGTGVKLVNVDLDGPAGPDGSPDVVTVNGTTGSDRIAITADATADAVVVDGLGTQLRVTHPEPTADQLIVNANGGGDRVTFGPGLDALMIVTVNP